MMEPFGDSHNVNIKCMYDIACILHKHLQVNLLLNWAFNSFLSICCCKFMTLHSITLKCLLITITTVKTNICSGMLVIKSQKYMLKNTCHLSIFNHIRHDRLKELCKLEKHHIILLLKNVLQTNTMHFDCFYRIMIVMA